MIPPFDNRGMLPIGLHDTSVKEIREALGFSRRRETLIDGLERYLREWDRHHLLESVIIDGSFVTYKAEPGDIDILLVPTTEALSSMTLAKLIPQMCYDEDGIREEFGCHAFPVLGSDSENYREWYEFFSMDRHGNIRGLVRVNLPL